MTEEEIETLAVKIAEKIQANEAVPAEVRRIVKEAGIPDYWSARAPIYLGPYMLEARIDFEPTGIKIGLSLQGRIVWQKALTYAND